ncbi:CYFA0S30e00914g1_1 [Cyberlindnera fabianii]|uniref:RBR-type E3 ubiquitin transferase n=1 Tax=Cyberlindnera fabianii TaxID=36022 RepID=A0A061BBD8_CYBFA|nr:CYFA0S30e00914g1_1 [Cyberlindnera fabianii]
MSDEEYYDSDEAMESFDEYTEDESNAEDDEYIANTTRPRHSEYVAHTTADLTERMAGHAKEISEVLGLSQNDTITLLHHFKWNQEKLMDSYMENPDKVRDEAGILADTTDGTDLVATGKRHYSNSDDFMCPICCEQEHDSFQVSCGHEYCLKCYKRYINERVQKGEVIRCPGCDLSLDPSDIDAVCGTGVSNKLLESSIKSFVERHSTFKWCPAPDCTMLVEIIQPSVVAAKLKEKCVPIAECKRGHEFCLSCGLENHSPSPCDATAAWVKKCKDDSETVKWISTNTKTCGKCSTAIEKNGGCNHMTCKKCHHEFCWICGGDWSLHGTSYYQCNRYKAETKKEDKLDKEATKQSLQRYLHYYGLFQTHDISSRQDTRRCTDVEDSVRVLQENMGISWIEAQFLSEAAAALLKARRTLKWTYAFAYFCDQGNMLVLLENAQARLTNSVEALSKLFEIEEPQEIVNSKLEFLNKAHQAGDSQRAMVLTAMDCIKAGTLDITN